MDKKSALLVIDVQNVYCKPNEWACINMQEVIEYIKNMLSKFDENQIFFTSFEASKNPVGKWMDYNKIYKDINSNKYLNDYVDELKPYINNDNLFIKSTYSSLKNKELYNKLQNFDRIYITGVVAECCVLSTIFDLIDMGKEVVYCKNGIAGMNKENELSVINILQGLSPLHVIFI